MYKKKKRKKRFRVYDVRTILNLMADWLLNILREILIVSRQNFSQ